MIPKKELDPALPPATLVRDLDESVRRLIVTAKALYQGDWDDLAEDVRRRQAGKPYLFRLDLDPNDTLVWARRIKAYEAARGERLADVLTPEDKR